MSVLTIPKPDDRGEWLRVRHGHFNASDAACLYGCHPFKTLADVAVDKLAPEPVDNGQTEAMERGQRLEPFLLEWFGDRHGVSVETPSVLYVTGRMMATLDGEPVGGVGVWIEAKTTAQRWHDVPEHVYWQVVAQAAASGKSECWVVWIDADMRFKESLVVPEPAQVADVLERAEKFMDFIDLGMAPEGVDLSADHLAAMFPVPCASYAEVDDKGLAAIAEWDRRRVERLDAEKAEKDARDAVARLIAEHEGARHDGRVVATWKASTRTSLDTKRLSAENPDLVERYQRETTYRTLRVTKELEA